LSVFENDGVLAAVAVDGGPQVLVDGVYDVLDGDRYVAVDLDAGD